MRSGDRGPRSAVATCAVALTFVAACGDGPAEPGEQASVGVSATLDPPEPSDEGASPEQREEYELPPAPEHATGPNPEAHAAFDRLLADLSVGGYTTVAFDEMVDVGDARHAWAVADLLRLLQGTPDRDRLVLAFEALTGTDLTADPEFRRSAWRRATDHLIAWDLPAPDEYREMKIGVLTLIDDRWAPLFDDPDADVDWRWLNWGGVLIDDRPLGSPDPCPRGCIPALDDPGLVTGVDGEWYPDDALVFGIVHGGETVALPRNVMEVHEMVNMTIGGSRFGIPYCTLCGSAQAFLTDRAPGDTGDLVLRTSGLLNRSNKVTYDLVTGSVFDTFTGRAVSGPLREHGYELEHVTVVVTTWGAWRTEHPATSIVAEDGGIGRDYPVDPLGGRDDDGPIFPVGDIDERLDVHDRVVGVLPPDGDPVAFAVADARLAVEAGDTVTAGGVELSDEAGGLRARLADGTEISAHESFWFAWSQFHPDTQLWPNG